MNITILLVDRALSFHKKDAERIIGIGIIDGILLRNNHLRKLEMASEINSS